MPCQRVLTRAEEDLSRARRPKASPSSPWCTPQPVGAAAQEEEPHPQQIELAQPALTLPMAASSDHLSRAPLCPRPCTRDHRQASSPLDTTSAPPEHRRSAIKGRPPQRFHLTPQPPSTHPRSIPTPHRPRSHFPIDQSESEPPCSSSAPASAPSQVRQDLGRETPSQDHPRAAEDHRLRLPASPAAVEARR